jgi:salicylate hydroxylase
MVRDGPVIIAGAGIAGLTAAIAFAAKGYSVRVFERSEKLEEVGAGLQLSPNATRILRRLGVLELLQPRAVRPEAVILRQASDLSELARVPLGDFAERRWKAPYLVAHRADLQNALLEKISGERSIELTTGARVCRASISSGAAGVSVEIGGKEAEVPGCLVVGADGVWSTLRPIVAKAGKSRFAGTVAWRTTIPSESTTAEMLLRIGADTSVTAFLHAGAHMIVYPVRSGRAFNLVAFTPGRHSAENWAAEADSFILHNALRSTAPELRQLVKLAGPWTIWPIYTVDSAGPSTYSGGLALIGDAAHAMTPFAAQGAAMAIEDADTLAAAVSAAAGDLPAALADWESLRRPRIQHVARRGALNSFAWRAAGPAALARNLFLKLRSAENLAADLDWLYGWGA